MDALDPRGNVPAFSTYRWRFAPIGRPSPGEAAGCGLGQAATTVVRLLYIRCVIACCGFAILPSIRSEPVRLRGTDCVLRCRVGRCDPARSYSEISSINNGLQKTFDHGSVLFVQHPLEKGRSGAALSGSFIACAEVLGNCDHATEGGIPRSSR